MTREQLLEKAVFIQYPSGYGKYENYDVDKDIIKIPLPKRGEMYDGYPANNNHFTTKYHRERVIPILCNILNISFNQNEFELEDRKDSRFDLSFLKPKNEYTYEIFGYMRNEHFENLSFLDITNSTINENGITGYHKLYKYPHECSRLINKSIHNGRKLFISGDSQFIPDVSFLSCFFEEIFYFDNRKGLKLSDKYKDTDFTDVIIELNCGKLETYIRDNIS